MASPRSSMPVAAAAATAAVSPAAAASAASDSAKREAATADSSAAAKRSKAEPSFPAIPQAAFYLTKLRRGAVPDLYNDDSFCMSLRDILSLPGTLQFSVQFNYEIDVEWTLEQYPPHLRSLPLHLVLGSRSPGQLMADAALLQQHPNISVLIAPNIPQYGTHHTKMMLLFYREGLRVVIHTGNLVAPDWIYKTDAMWISPLFPRLDPAVERKPDASVKDVVGDFGKELWSYLLQYGSVRATGGFSMKQAREHLAAHDMSQAKVRLVASVPGYHRGETMHQWGHMRLRSLLSKYSTERCTDIVMQLSSIGSLGKDPLSPTSWIGKDMTTSLRASAKGHLGSKPPTLRLIFPTTNTVRNSLEGWAGGGALPHNIKYAQAHAPLVSIAHDWRAEWCGRSRALPHIKTFTGWNADSKRPSWLYLGSHNLSKAAWGQLQKNNTQTQIRSYELGVLFLPELLGAPLVPWPQVGSASGSLIAIPLPYDWPPTPYQRGPGGKVDKMWFTGEAHREPDIYGRVILDDNDEEADEG